MIARIAHILLVLSLTLGVVAPKASAALASLGLIRGDVIVICTGEGLRTIHLGGDGKPVELSDTPQHCLLVHALDAPVLPPLPHHAPTPRAVAGAWVFAAEPALRLATQKRPRAPPAAQRA